MALKVFGTGQGRTGTTSLKLALEHLGFGKCYHMFELMAHPEQIVYFEKAERGEKVDWDKLFEGYQSACDMPVIRYYQDILKRYPDAKLIHTTRDPDSWYKSMMSTIFWALNPSIGRKLNMMIRLPFSKTLRKRLRILKYNGKMVKSFFGDDLHNKAKVLEHFNHYNQQVLASIPADKILIYDVKTGWEPLCKYLGVPVPSIPFPKSNTKDEFIYKVKNMLGQKKISL